MLEVRAEKSWCKKGDRGVTGLGDEDPETDFLATSPPRAKLHEEFAYFRTEAGKGGVSMHSLSDREALLFFPRHDEHLL